MVKGITVVEINNKVFSKILFNSQSEDSVKEYWKARRKFIKKYS